VQEGCHLSLVQNIKCSRRSTPTHSTLLISVSFRIYPFLVRHFRSQNILKIAAKSQSHFKAVSQTVSQSVCLGVEPTLWTFDQILLPFQEIGSGICCPVSVERPLLREVGSVSCKSQSIVICLCTFTIKIFVFHAFTIHMYIYLYIIYIHIYYTIHLIYARPLLVPARYSRL
jgi:hypothetical protein